MTQEQIERAKHIFLTRNIGEGIKPDLVDIAFEIETDEVIDAGELKVIATRQQWNKLRAQAEQEYLQRVSDDTSELAKAAADDLIKKGSSTFKSLCDFVEYRELALLEYLDDLMESNKLGAKEALSYLKLIVDTKFKIIDYIGKATNGEKETTDGVQDLLSELQQKADTIRALSGNKIPDDSVIEHRRNVFEGLDGTGPKR